ncbi:MAG: hypothetical protein M1298_05920 [Chloroflexi bacterium]|nr:hypothetical protein [Chloroflexota bacterium]
MSTRSWLPALAGLLVAALVIPLCWLLVAHFFGVPVMPSASATGLLATMGGVMGAIFTVGGLVIALVAILMQLTLTERVHLLTEQKFQELLPGVERQTRALLLWGGAHQTLMSFSWEQAEDSIRQALEQYPQLGGARSWLGLSLSTMVVTAFLTEHDWVRANAHTLETIGSLLRHTPSLSSRSSTSMPVTEAIKWLETAIEHNDGSESQVREALALMYGVNRRFEKMKKAITEAIALDAAARGRLRESAYLPLLAFACSSQQQLSELGGLLGHTLPQPREEVCQAVEQLDPSTNSVNWWVKRNGLPSSPDFPLVVAIALQTENGERRAHAWWGVGPNREDLPPNPSGQALYLPAGELVGQLSQRFFFLCPVTDR